MAASLLSILLLALAIAISAEPVLEQKSSIKLPLMKRQSFSKYNIMERDQRRSNSLMRRANGSDFNSTTTSTDLPAVFKGNDYVVQVSIGVGEDAENCK